MMWRHVKLAEEYRVAVAYAWHPAHGRIRLGAGLESVTIALSGALAVSWRSSLRMMNQDLYGWRDTVGQWFFCGFSESSHCNDITPAKESENPESIVRFFLQWLMRRPQGAPLRDEQRFYPYKNQWGQTLTTLICDFLYIGSCLYGHTRQKHCCPHNLPTNNIQIFLC